MLVIKNLLKQCIGLLVEPSGLQLSRRECNATEARY